MAAENDRPLHQAGGWRKKIGKMSGTRIGRMSRRLRLERELSQQGLAARLDISPSYLNLIEHNQRAVTAQILIKLTRVFDVPMEMLSGSEEQMAGARVREALSDPALGGIHDIPPHELTALISQPSIVSAILALHQAARAARHDAETMQLPTGQRIILPQEEVRHLYERRNNHFEELESCAEDILEQLASDRGLKDSSRLSPPEVGYAILNRLRHHHNLDIHITKTEGSLRNYDLSLRRLQLSELMPRESREFQLCFQLVLLEADDLISSIVEAARPGSDESRTLMKIGLANYTAASILMPYDAFLAAARDLRHDIDCIAARFGVSFHQAAHRLASMQKPGARGIPFFFARIDQAGNISKHFSACNFPILRQGNPCPRWNGCTAFSTPGNIVAETSKFANGATFLTFAKTVTGIPAGPGEMRPIHSIAMGCPIEHAPEIVYADHLGLQAEPSHIGLSCHLCDWTDCRSRAFPPLNHRLTPDLNNRTTTPFAIVPE